MRAQAIIQTENARRYLGQFCKHFAHKLPVQLDPALASGQVTFGAGLCRISADEDMLTLEVGAATEEAVATVQEIVARHLVRFAFREQLTLSWQTPG